MDEKISTDLPDPHLAHLLQAQFEIGFTKIDAKIDRIQDQITNAASLRDQITQVIKDEVAELKSDVKEVQRHMEDEIQRRDKALADNRRFTIQAVVIPILCVLLAALFYWLSTKGVSKASSINLHGAIAYITQWRPYIV